LELREHYAGRLAVVTGAGGFIGSHLVDALLDAGARVRTVDRRPLDECANLADVRERADHARLSITDADGLAPALAGADFVFHLAANASVPLSVRNPEWDFELNAVGSLRVAEAFRRAGAGRLVFTSTAAVYGEPERDPVDEEHPLRPQSPYAASKLAAEFLLEAQARCFGFDQRRVRLFNTYGPRQSQFVMHDLLEKLRRDPRRLEVLGTGEQVRTYNDVGEAARAILFVGAHPDARGRVHNVAGEEAVSIRELVALVVEAAGLPPPTVVFTGESWPGDIRRLVGDTSRLRGLGFAPRTPLRDGLRRLVAWYRQTRQPAW